MARLRWPLATLTVTFPFGGQLDSDQTYYVRHGYAGHEGVDLRAAVGTPVYAAHNGQATCYGSVDASVGYGLYVVVEGDGLRTIYAHLSETCVASGDVVTAGQLIGRSGATGYCLGAHLHFGLCPLPRDERNGYQGYVDPMPWLTEGVTMSKLGVHFQASPELGTEATELVRASNIRWVKGIDVDRWPTPAGEMFPGKRTLARQWIGGDNIEEPFVLRGAAGADEYIALLASRYRTLRAQGVSDVLGPNEMHPAAGTIQHHVAFWDRWARRMVADFGLRPWFGSFGVGWPDIGQITAYTDVARYCADHGGGMEVHEYGAPDVLDGNGWWTLRYRRTLAELGFDVPVIVGECGIDWGVVPGQKNTGWKSHKEYVYPEQYGLPSGLMTEERYWRQLSAYDDELLKDNYVVAAVPFVTCPEASWATFDFGGSLIRRVVAKHAAGTAEPEPEPELPIVGPTDEAIRNAGWNALGVAYNPAAAFQAYAREHGLGAPLRDEHDVDGVRMQEFMGGIVYAPVGRWDETTHVAW